MYMAKHTLAAIGVTSWSCKFTWEHLHPKTLNPKTQQATPLLILPTKKALKAIVVFRFIIEYIVA
jgi:hypothetical protein